MLERLDEDTGVDVPPGPLPENFRDTIKLSLDKILADAEHGGVLALVDVDTEGRKVIDVGVAHKFYQGDKWEWRVGAEFEKVLGGPASGRVVVWAKW